MSAITGEDTVASLRARLERTERQATARQRQLERYAADLREVFKQERARAQELRALLHGDRARALQRRRGARRLHRQARRARRRLRDGARPRRRALDVEDSPQIEFGFLLHDIGKVAVPGRDPVQDRAR